MHEQGSVLFSFPLICMMKIYTRTGDGGLTSLIGGTRVPKHHIKIEAYGTVDELNSHLGLLRDTFDDTHSRDVLLTIQNELFIIGSLLAEDRNKSKMVLPELHEGMITALENEIDLMNESLPELKFFIVPGGHPVSSQAHIARCICRRAERCVSHLSELEALNPLIIRYLNRLSDHLFTVARFAAWKNNATEIPWQMR
jgi:cob(I)alamin adenosyltransferase